MITIEFVFLAVYLPSVFAVAYAILSPFKEVASRKPEGGRRVYLVDIFAVFLSFQFGFALLNWFFPDIAERYSTGIVMFLVVVAWIYGLRLLWRMNVKSGLKRMTFLGVVMPFAIVISVTALPILIYIESVQQLIVRGAILVGLLLSLRSLGLWVRAETSITSAPIAEEVSRDIQ